MRNLVIHVGCSDEVSTKKVTEIESCLYAVDDIIEDIAISPKQRLAVLALFNVILGIIGSSKRFTIASVEKL